MKLTRRQDEVLRLLAQGLTNDQIGLALGICSSTSRTHVYALCRAFNVPDRAQAVIKAFRMGMIMDELSDDELRGMAKACVREMVRREKNRLGQGLR